MSPLDLTEKFEVFGNSEAFCELLSRLPAGPSMKVIRLVLLEFVVSFEMEELWKVCRRVIAKCLIKFYRLIVCLECVTFAV